MAFEYFSKLPVIDYPISQTQTKRGRDILHRFFVDQKYAKMNEYLMQYRAEDGDALDVISAKLYRRADYHSIIMFINPAKGVFGGGLPISSAVQEEYMDTLYGDTVHLLSHTVPPVVIYDWVPSGPTAPPEIKTKIDSARAEQYIIVYQSIDVPSQTTGVIDTSLAITSINEQIAQGKNPNGWGMLDYEKPFDTVLQNGPTDPLYTTCVNSMLSTLRAVKAAFPGIRWTYYGIPGLSYYTGAALWPFADEAARQAEIERQIRGYGPILRELDWYNPSAYDIWNQANIPPPPTPNQPDPAQVAVHERVYRMARVGVVKEFLRRNGLENRPILPAVSPFFAPGACGDPWPAVDPYTLSGGRIPQNQIYSDQIQPVLDAGADGVAIWSGKDYWTRLATSNNIPSSQDGYTAQQEARYAYTIDYFAGITPGSVSSAYAGWTAQATKATITQGVGNAIADMAVAAAGSTALQVGRDVYPIFGYGLEEGETVFSWFPGNPDQEVDTETSAVVGEWNARMMTVKLDQVKGSFPVGTILGNESKTALFRVTKKIQEKDAVHHFEATQDTFAGTPLKKGSIIDPLSAVYPVSGGVVLTPIGNPGICGGSTGSYFNSLVYLQNTIGIPPAISPYIKAVSNQEQEYRKMESNRTMNVPSNNPNLLEGLVRAVEDILDGVQ